MSRSEAAKELAPMIGDLGGRFMLDPVGFGRAGEMNLEPGFAVYFAGRFGVLGRVHADVVVASAAFIEPELVHREWDIVLADADPTQAAEIYTSIAAEYGRAHFSDVPGLDRWCELAGRIADGASPVGAPLFAGWRAVPRPDDLPARACVLAQVLRELRFSLHVSALVVAGFDPLMSILCGSRGAGAAGFFGWPEPYPEPTPADRAGRRSVEETTNELSIGTLSPLSDDEVEEFVSLTEGIIEAAV